MNEESKMVPPGDFANADAATPKSAAIEALQAIAGWGDLWRADWDSRFPAWEARYRELGGTLRGDRADLDVTVDLFIQIARAGLGLPADGDAKQSSTTDASQTPGMNPDQLATHP